MGRYGRVRCSDADQVVSPGGVIHAAIVIPTSDVPRQSVGKVGGNKSNRPLCARDRKSSTLSAREIRAAALAPQSAGPAVCWPVGAGRGSAAASAEADIIAQMIAPRSFNQVWR